jgi:hypothetical protein
MYTSSSSPSFQSHSVPFTLPLDPDLQEKSLQPLGTLQFNRPYGDLVFDKTRRTLSLPSSPEHDALKLTALSQLIEVLSRPQKVQVLLEQGVFAELVLNAGNENQEVRVLATAALAALTGARAGRDFAIQADIVPRLAKLASNDEPSAAVRSNVLKSFFNMAGSQAGVQHLLSGGLIEQLVEKIGSEADLACRAQTLEILSVVLREPAGWKAATQAKIVPMVAKVLRAMLTDAPTLAATDAVINADGVIATNLKPLFSTISFLAKVVAHISAVGALEGKDECVKCEIVPLLVTLLSHPVSSLRIQSSLALQNLTNAESGKKAALEAQAIQPLLDATKDTEEMVQCQAMQALTNLAEHPAAKGDERVQQAVPDLKRASETAASAKVKHAATLAVQQITWQP